MKFFTPDLLNRFGSDDDRIAFNRPNSPGSLLDGQSARIVSELLA